MTELLEMLFPKIEHPFRLHIFQCKIHILKNHVVSVMSLLMLQMFVILSTCKMNIPIWKAGHKETHLKHATNFI